jgi:hypothetical protein
MEKTVDLTYQEQQLLSSFESERQQALAMYGALALDMDNAKKTLESALEKQRAFLRSTLITKGIDRYENARLINNNTAIQITTQDSDAAFNPQVVDAPLRANGPTKAPRTIAEK